LGLCREAASKRRRRARKREDVRCCRENVPDGERRGRAVPEGRQRRHRTDERVESASQAAHVRRQPLPRPQELLDRGGRLSRFNKRFESFGLSRK
jgi:hypothetical protein